MITGSIAAKFYAVPRMIPDIGIVLELAPEEIGKFILGVQEDNSIERISSFASTA